jgi:uncharacterized membrane protein
MTSLPARLLHLSGGLTGSAVRFAAAYLVVHGIVKVVLVVALLRTELWAYPWMIGFLVVSSSTSSTASTSHPRRGS